MKYFIHTSESFKTYWLVGGILFGLILPISLADILVDPGWYAPHWQCDSLGAVFAGFTTAFLPWTALSVIVSGLLCALLIRNRLGGSNIIYPQLARSAWNWTVSILIYVVCLWLFAQFVFHFWEALVPQTIVADCSGSAEPITVVRRKPIFQLMPLLSLGLATWFLHLRALFVSPKN